MWEFLVGALGFLMVVMKEFLGERARARAAKEKFDAEQFSFTQIALRNLEQMRIRAEKEKAQAALMEQQVDSDKPSWGKK